MPHKFVANLLKSVLLAPMQPVEEKPPVLSYAEIDSKPFWEGLDSLGPDQEVRIQRIKEAHPIHICNEDPYYLRRETYKAILKFRTVCIRQWVYDVKDIQHKHEEKVLG